MSSDRSYRDRDTLVRLATTMNDTEMARFFGCSNPTIRFWRDRHGLPRSTANPGGRRWMTNRGFFDVIDTPEKAYILGFIIADGCIHRNGKSIAIAIKETDRKHLVKIAECLGCAAPIRSKRGSGFSNGRPTSCLNLCGRQLVNSLAVLGVHPGKSLTATYPAVPAELERHLVRGLWDGDGWIGRRQFSLVGTEALISGVIDAVWRHTECKLSVNLKAAHPLHPYAVGSRRDRDVMQWMYADAGLVLERKAEAFQLYWG